MDEIEEQNMEIEALKAIYMDDFTGCNKIIFLKNPQN